VSGKYLFLHGLVIFLILYAYLATCAALLQIEGAAEYEQAIRKYLEHPNEQVRWWAEHALGIEGPDQSEA
jgi:hypothetical protein